MFLGRANSLALTKPAAITLDAPFRKGEIVLAFGAFHLKTTRALGISVAILVMRGKTPSAKITKSWGFKSMVATLNTLKRLNTI